MTYLASNNPSEAPKSRKISILGVNVDDISEKDAILTILKLAKDKQGQHFVATVNSEFVMLAQKDYKFAKILKNTDLNLPDSVGVVIAKLILGGSEKNRVTGTDLIEKLCEKSAVLPITVGFLGGFGDVAAQTAKRQQARYRALKVVFVSNTNPVIGHNLRLNTGDFPKKRVDILFVAYGMGMQEKWIAENKAKFDVGVFIGVGGGFDYQSGAKRRSPRILQNIGLEWFWRFLAEPQRIWRMRVLPIFAVLVIWQFLTQKRSVVTKNI